MRIAVCDDDRIFLTIVETQIRNYFQRLGLSIELELFSDAERFWEAFARAPFHLAILDIIMPGISGIELSRRIFRENRNCIIAFLTSSPDYALDGYGVNAVGYLLKPATQEQMDELLAKCVARHQEARPAAVLFKVSGAVRRVEAADILFLESRNKQVIVHCLDQTFTCAGKLSDFLEQLPPGFVQTHKSYIANLRHVTSLTREEMTAADGSRIPISRQFHKDAASSYHAYRTGG